MAAARLTLGDQVLGYLGLPLQPRQPRLLVHAGHLLAGGQALAVLQQVITNLQDVRRLRLDLEPWRDPQAVRELDEQLAVVGALCLRDVARPAPNRFSG